MSDVFKAMVVDDDEISRRVIGAALEKENFRCSYARDGKEAIACFREQDYELLVTDLMMPNMNGHALAMEVMQINPKPLIIVHSIVKDPAIIKDLILRGVDDIIPKPTDYASFAAKIRALVSRRSRQAAAAALSSESPLPPPQLLTASESESDRISSEEIENKIPLITRIMPLTNVAMDVFNLTREDCDAHSLAVRIQDDPSLAAEVLAIANSSFYNPTHQAISGVEKAVIQIGQRRLGELALATSLLTTITERNIPWMSMKTIWRQSMAAGIAAEHLIRQGKHQAIRNDLVLIAIMSSLGEIVLATLYPPRYERMVRNCAETGRSLLEEASRVFPETHAATLSRVQEAWELPAGIYTPTRYLADSYDTVAALPEPLRTRIELVKVAVFVGKLVANAWHPWDHVDIPPANVLARLAITDCSELITQTREDAKVIGKLGEKAVKRPSNQLASGPSRGGLEVLHYKNVSSLPVDVAATLIETMGLKTTRATSAPTSKTSNVVVNALGLDSERAAIVGETTLARKVLVLTDAAPVAEEVSGCTFLTFPTSYGRLNATLQAMATGA